MAEFEVMRYPDRDARHEKWMAAYEVVWRNQQGSEYISVPFSYEQFLEHRLSESERRIKELEKAQLAPATSAPRGGTAAADVLAKADHLASLRPGAVDSVEGIVIDAAQVIRELRSELAAARERERALREALEQIERNAIKNEPTENALPAWLYAQAWTLWIVGGVARNALQAAQAQQPGRADGYAVGQEVILLDGTSLIGQVIEKGYKVSLDGSEGRWYSAAELAAYVAGKAQDVASE